MFGHAREISWRQVRRFGFAVGLVTLIGVMRRRRRERLALGRLDERLLADIGVPRDKVGREIAKSPWQV